jgi:hypothetical protein
MELNNRPRKTLGWKKPIEVYSEKPVAARVPCRNDQLKPPYFAGALLATPTIEAELDRRFARPGVQLFRLHGQPAPGRG